MTEAASPKADLGGRSSASWALPRSQCLFLCRGLNRSAVGKTQVSFTSRRLQQLAPSTLTSLLACTNALRRAILRHGYAWRQPRFNSSLCGRPALFPERAPCPSIQSTLKQKLCPSRLRPPRLHPQGRRGLSSGRARLRPCGYNILQRTNPLRGGKDPGLVHKPSASATRPIDSDFAPCLYQRAAPCYSSAWLRLAAASVQFFTLRSPGTLPRTRPLPICSIYIEAKAVPVAASSSEIASARPTGPEFRPRSFTALRIQHSSDALRRNRRQARASSSAPASTRSGVVNPSV